MAQSKWRAAARKLQRSEEGGRGSRLLPGGGDSRSFDESSAARTARRKASRPEWKNFRDERMIFFLSSMDEGDGAEANKDDGDGDGDGDTGDDRAERDGLSRAELAQLVLSNPAFVREALLLCLEKRRGSLAYYVDVAKEALGGGDPASTAAVKQFWTVTFGMLYEKVREAARMLRL